MTTKAISDGLRKDFATEQGARVFTLTRSAFAGQQSTGAFIQQWQRLLHVVGTAATSEFTGATLWSGDISGAWDSLRRLV